MRYFFLLLSFSILFSTKGFAQTKFYYGLKAGVTYGTPIGPAEEGASGSPGIGPVLGAFGELQLSEKVGILSDISYVQKKAKFATPVTEKEYSYPYNPISQPDTTVYIETIFTGNVKGEFDNKYLEIPVLFQYHFSEQMSVLAGPYFSFLLSPGNIGSATGNVGFGNLPVENQEFDESEFISKFDFGGALGLRYNTNFGVHVDFRATTGLKSVYQADYSGTEDLIRNVYLSLTAGYRFQSFFKKNKEGVILPNTDI